MRTLTVLFTLTILFSISSCQKWSKEKKEKASVLPNYDSYRQRLAQDRKNKVVKIFDVLKKVSDIEDNRAAFHGVQ